MYGDNLERFRVLADTLTFVDRNPPARTSNPFTTLSLCSTPARFSSACYGPGGKS